MPERALLQARIRSRLLTAVAATALVVLVTVSGTSSRLDTGLYDAFARLVPAHADPRIVLVEIDQASIAQIGGWPWSRRVHARLLERLTAAGARGVALEVLLSEPALFDPEGDALLARAIDRSGKVVLPVYAIIGTDGGTAVELLPIREFAAPAAALGHVDQSPDHDGTTRSLYLHAGVGAPRWPAMALAMKQLDRSGELALHEVPEPLSEQLMAASRSWRRTGRVMLPPAQERNAYERFSYVEVLGGQVPEASLRGRWVVVSPVVAGLGPARGTPDSEGHPSRSAQFQLHALDALVQGRTIAPLSLAAQIGLSALLVILPLLLTGLPRLRSLGRPLLIAIAVTLLLTWLLLVGAQAWFAPGAALLVLALAAAAWAARRLRQVRRSEAIDPLTGLANREMFTESLQQELRLARRSGQPLSLLLIELDQFGEAERAQDRNATDAMVRKLAAALCTRARRPRDIVARLDGGRFAILLPETTTQAAAAIATTIHVDLANAAVCRDSGNLTQGALTTSIGMHTAHGDDGSSSDELVARADAARVQAGLAGGNRTSSFGEMAQAPP